MNTVAEMAAEFVSRVESVTNLDENASSLLGGPQINVSFDNSGSLTIAPLVC